MPLALGLGLGITIGGGVSFSPTALFASGEQGVWYDPSDFSTMFQDSAGTTPVTAVGDPVGKILDKSGRGNHATQGTSASRPVLQQDSGGRYYLSFDGTDDSLATSSITPGVDKIQVFAGVRKISDATVGCVAELSATTSANNGAFILGAPGSNTGANYSFTSKGTVSNFVLPSGYTSPITNVLTGIGDISGSNIVFRANGSQAAQSPASQGTGNFGSYPLYIGRRGGSSLPYNGRLYGLIVRFSSANLSDATISQVETWMNARTGAF